MSDPMQLWTLFFGAATLFLILVQVAILGGLLWAFLSFRSAAKQIQENLKAEGLDSHRLVADLHHALITVERAATKTAQLAESADEMVEKANHTIEPGLGLLSALTIRSLRKVTPAEAFEHRR